MRRKLELLLLRMAILCRHAYAQLKGRMGRYARPIAIASFLIAASFSVYWFFHTPAPGKAVALLGAVAVLMALRGDMHGSEKIIWTLVVFFLLYIEIRAINKDRVDAAKDEATARATEQEHFGRLFQMSQDTQATMIGFFKAQQEVTQANLLRTQKHKGFDELMELKSRAADLSAAIFGLLVDRSLMSPPPPRPGTWEQDVARSVPFDQDTVLLYEQKYGASTRQIVEKLAACGLKDETLEIFVKAPNSPLIVRGIANHLSAQAERITPDGIRPLTKLLIP